MKPIFKLRAAEAEVAGETKELERWLAETLNRGLQDFQKQTGWTPSSIAVEVVEDTRPKHPTLDPDTAQYVVASVRVGRKA